MSALAAAGMPAPPAPEELPRLLSGLRRGAGAVTLAEHRARWGDLPAPGDLAGLVEASGLTGRGGGAFPTGRKLRAVAQAGRRSVVVGNGVEGEPASAKDKVLMRRVPHLVLDGLVLAAEALGAEETILALGEGSAAERAALEAALAERERARLDRLPVRLASIPDRFVAGEETALVRCLNGGPPKPTLTPPRPFERGVRGLPTLVQNVETLANVALVARFGPRWFRGLGTADEPGTALVTLDGAVARPGVYEVPLGFPLEQLLAWAGGTSAPLEAVLLGGYFGTWIPAAEALASTLADADLAAAGASLGARTVFALPVGACGIVETARVARYLAGESAGQCGPCVHGLDAVAGALERLAARGSAQRGTRERLLRWLEQVKGRGACRHPDGAARLVESALDVFAEELQRHARGGCSGRSRPLLRLAPRR
ncbi:MAG TPA: NADH-ubiquinone oxidoreductase-F iron-sulfur binding region domain-containing protein [Gaiellaceae bacterium]|nr:NADH-ubiquinone oxidoreductase-F iron-sulfur binding region domain-containing protein [Gaiellaceae bacterium]